MQEKPKRHLTRRGRLVAGIAMGVTVAAAAVLVPRFMASADEAPVPSVLTDIRQLDSGAQLPRRPDRKGELPPGAVTTDKGPSTPGARSRAFESPANRTRVVGGQEVSAADHPGVVGIRTYFLEFVKNKPVYKVTICTGTVLSPTRVLTAAHCGIGLSYAYGTEVIAGRNDLDTEAAGFVARVASAWTLPSYNLNAQLNTNADAVDDITVLHLKDKLPAVYKPVKLGAQSTSETAPGTDALVVGYGVNKAGDSASLGVLRAGAVKVVRD